MGDRASFRPSGLEEPWSLLQTGSGTSAEEIYPDYEDNAPTMSESAFNRMTYPRPISEPPSPVSTRPSSPERRSRPGSPGARSIYSMNSDGSASHDSEEELDALELEQN